jgi:hypothetical protein
MKGGGKYIKKLGRDKRLPPRGEPTKTGWRYLANESRPIPLLKKRVRLLYTSLIFQHSQSTLSIGPSDSFRKEEQKLWGS